MRPNKMIASLSALFLICSCYGINAHADIKWAEIDESKVVKAVTDMAKEQNSAQYNRMKEKYNELKNKKSDLSSLISTKKDEEKTRCREQYPREDGGKKHGALVLPDEPVIAGSTTESAYSVMGRATDEYNTCISNIANIESINKLEEDYTQVSRAIENKKDFDRELSRISESEAKKLIETYASKEYDLVVKKSSSNIVYSKNKIKVDITDAVIEYIQNKKPDLVVKGIADNPSLRLED